MTLPRVVRVVLMPVLVRRGVALVLFAGLVWRFRQTAPSEVYFVEYRR